ncbi:hypothetical protein Efla_005274 [Eimeria flavescens]
MSPRTPSEEAKEPTTTITGSFCCKVQTRQRQPVGRASRKDVDSGQNLSTRGRKLLAAESPEVLRPHCEACGAGEALRPGLDCRCHCPQCSSGKPRCSSPRMALRREEQETCDSFRTKLAMTRSRTAARRMQPLFSETVVKQELAAKAEAKRNASSERILKRKPTPGIRERTNETNSNADAIVKLGKKGNKLEAAHQPSGEKEASSVCSEKLSCTQAPSDEPSPIKIKKVKKGAISGQKSRDKTTQGNTLQQITPLPSVCKRGRNAAIRQDASSSCLTEDYLATKYRRPHCPMCSQLGCLRNLEMICYCDPCQERRGEGCSSPRMADFRKSHPDYVSR